MPIKFTEKKINALIKEGRGKGRHEEYKSWILIRETVGLKSRKTRVKGIKSGGRVLNLLSDLEAKYNDQVTLEEDTDDIREGFPFRNRKGHML